MVSCTQEATNNTSRQGTEYKVRQAITQYIPESTYSKATIFNAKGAQCICRETKGEHLPGKTTHVLLAKVLLVYCMEVLNLPGSNGGLLIMVAMCCRCAC